MIVDSGKYFLYRHIRPDTGQPFYVGIGTKSKHQHTKYKTEYSRMFSTYNKGHIWKSIVNKNNGLYSTEVILESNDYTFILNKEVEFIALYGRKDVGTGILANLTDGGDTLPGCSMKYWKRKKLVNTKFFNKEHTKIPIYQYDLKGKFIREWKSCKDASTELNKRISLRTTTSAGFMWFKEYQGEQIKPFKLDTEKLFGRRLIAYNKQGEPIMCFKSFKSAAEELNVLKGGIEKSIKRGYHAKGYYFKYINNDFI